MQSTPRTPFYIFMNENPKLNQKAKGALEAKGFFLWLLFLLPLIFGGDWSDNNRLTLSTIGPMIISSLCLFVSVMYFETLRTSKINDYFLIFLNCLIFLALVALLVVGQSTGQYINALMVTIFATVMTVTPMLSVKNWRWGSEL
tara:strand:+ start:6334 stop:6765 length:432 start_codon:yes stop_codon:yes gene_type:complete